MDFDILRKNMIQGFNTYYNNSVLTHVLMPQGIAVSLGFKFYNSGKILKEALIGRFGEYEEKIHPGPRSFDGRYTEMTFTCSGHKIMVQSAVIDDNQYLLVTPIENGKKPASLLISIAVLWNRPGTVAYVDGRLLAHTPERNLEVFTDGQVIRQMNVGLTNPYIAVELSKPVAVSTDKNISAKELTEVMKRQKEMILDECNKYGDLAEAYNAMRTCLAWDTIYEPEKEQICSPVSRLWNINWGGYVLFDWDTYFSAMLAMMEDKNLAYANAIAITHEKTESGFVPNFGAADDNKSRDRSQPPVGSLTVKEIYRVYREDWLIRYLFDELLTWNRWYANHRRLPNGQLCWGSNPFEGRNGAHWETDGVNDRFGAALESGLDNSPMYDDMVFNKDTHMMGLADVGLTGLYIMDCEALADLADIIGRPEVAELRERAALSKAGLEEMWDEEFGMYLNKITEDGPAGCAGDFSRRISPTNFYALYSDCVSSERVSRMMNEHFYNEQEFYGEFIIPTIARNDPAYPDQNYWRGRIWAPTNFLAYMALRKQAEAGVSDAASACKDLAEKSKNLLLKEWLLHGHVHENYNGDNGMGCGVRNSDKFYHWGALLSLIALMEAGFVEGPEKPL